MINQPSPVAIAVGKLLRDFCFDGLIESGGAVNKTWGGSGKEMSISPG